MTENFKKNTGNNKPTLGGSASPTRSYTFSSNAKEIFSQLKPESNEGKVHEKERPEKKTGIVRQKKGRGRGCC